MKILRKLTCAVRGHKYQVFQELTPWSRRVVCPRCGGDWGMNDDVRAFLPWNREFENMYRVLGVKLREKK